MRSRNCSTAAAVAASVGDGAGESARPAKNAPTTSTTTAAARPSGAGDISQDIQLRRAGRRFGSSRAHTVRSNDGGGSTATALSSMTPSTRCSRTYSPRHGPQASRCAGGALLLRRRRLAVVVKNQFVFGQMCVAMVAYVVETGRSVASAPMSERSGGATSGSSAWRIFFTARKMLCLVAFVFSPAPG